MIVYLGLIAIAAVAYRLGVMNERLRREVWTVVLRALDESPFLTATQLHRRVEGLIPMRDLQRELRAMEAGGLISSRPVPNAWEIRGGPMRCYQRAGERSVH
jgi:hypothetical protein